MKWSIEFLATFLSVGLSACSDSKPCINYNYQSQFNYQINATLITPKGIQVDPTGQTISLKLIDQKFDEVEKCLTDTFGNPAHIPSDLALKAQCENSTFDLPIHRSCITVKIPNDWLWNCDGTEQLLPALAPQSLCNAKGLSKDPNCPCRWRAGIQDDFVIVATPDLYLIKDPLIRIATGCNNPWIDELAKCAAPDAK